MNECDCAILIFTSFNAVPSLIAGVRRDVRQMKRQLIVIQRNEAAERDRLVANISSQMQETRSQMQQLQHLQETCSRELAELRNVTDRQRQQLEEIQRQLSQQSDRHMESCRWPASRGSPRLSSGRNTYIVIIIVISIYNAHSVTQN